MSKNPRNVDTDDLGSGHGGSGARAAHRTEAAAAERDNTALGREAHRADAAGHTQPHGEPGEPMTAEQAAHLRILSAEAGEHFDERLDRAAADRRIDELQRRAGLKP